MRQDKKLQKKIQREFETPEISFEEWAAKTDVPLNAPERADCPIGELAENVSGSGISHGGRKRALGISLAVIVPFVVVAVVLLSVLLRPFSPKVYGGNDTVNRKIEYQEITEQEGIYLFDGADTVPKEAVNKDVLIEDESQVMMYTLQNCLLSVKNGEGADGFYVTYRIRTYHYYEFISCQRFFDLNNEVTVQKIKIDYKIDEASQPIAYAQFSDDRYEYFIEVIGFPNVTVLNEDNFINLLNQILI